MRWFGPLLIGTLCAGCSAVVLIEESRRVCGNGEDDDGDERIDCDDPSCAASGACEVTAETCRDGLDNNGDDRADCEEVSCRAGFCDSFVTECEVRPQSGCPRGMACYSRFLGLDGGDERRCRVAGVLLAGEPCDADALGALAPGDSHLCAAGNGCRTTGTPKGLCASYCGSDDDCPTGGLCTPSPQDTGRPGLCTEPCDPLVPSCPAGYSCVSFHERGEPYESGGARWACLDQTFERGAAPIGAECADPPLPESLASEVCVSSAACVPTATSGRGVCRQVCLVGDDACAIGSCQRLYPRSAPSALGMRVFGACL